MIRKTTIAPPPVNIKEIMRYASFKGEDGEVLRLINEAVFEGGPFIEYKACFSRLNVKKFSDRLSFGNIEIKSDTLSRTLTGCDELVVFAVTLGFEIDRFISKYSRVSPSKALIFQAFGAERVESLCDGLMEKINCELRPENKVLKPRVSPGFGDIPLEMQRSIFSLLDCTKTIGITLNRGLLMSPSKSVTAIAGIKKINCGELLK